MDVPGSGDDALTQPTRARLFELLVERRESMRTEELARAVDLHPNGVRRHLEKLHEAGLVQRRQRRGAKGRPGDHWSVAPGANPGGRSPSGYADLARWLARAIRPGPGRLRDVERTGREIGRELAPADSQDPIESFQEVLASLGFQPKLDRRAGGGYRCSLENCPFRDSVRESAEVVCSLHRGITAGLLAELDPDAKLITFEPHDPDRAGCMVEVGGKSGSKSKRE